MIIYCQKIVFKDLDNTGVYTQEAYKVLTVVGHTFCSSQRPATGGSFRYGMHLLYIDIENIIRKIIALHIFHITTFGHRNVQGNDHFLTYIMLVYHYVHQYLLQRVCNP